jgi:hypothetical protein
MNRARDPPVSHEHAPAVLGDQVGPRRLVIEGRPVAVVAGHIAEFVESAAVCPFIAGWLTRHPEYAHLEYRAASKVTD